MTDGSSIYQRLWRQFQYLSLANGGRHYLVSPEDRVIAARDGGEEPQGCRLIIKSGGASGPTAVSIEVAPEAEGERAVNSPAEALLTGLLTGLVTLETDFPTLIHSSGRLWSLLFPSPGKAQTASYATAYPRSRDGFPDRITSMFDDQILACAVLFRHASSTLRNALLLKLWNRHMSGLLLEGALAGLATALAELAVGTSNHGSLSNGFPREMLGDTNTTPPAG